MTRRILAFLSAALLAHAAMAQSSDFLAAMGGNSVLEVEINKGTPLRLSAPAASVAVADPGIADVQVISPRMLYINGRGVGETSVIAVDNNDNIILQSTVNVTHNLSRLKRAADELSPDGKVTASSTDNAIILKGKVESPVVAEKLQRLATSFLRNDQQTVVNMLDTSATDQVMLKVRVVELARNELKRFGINWESIINTGNFVFGLAQGRDFITAGALTRSLQNDGSISAGYNNGATSINTVIDALETDGLISVLAEPNLTTRSGMPASFLAGGEYPITVVQASTGAQPVASVEYRQFGVSLQFTPVVLSANKISLTVLPEVSSLDFANGVQQNGFTIPALSTRRASTTVDLGTGQTFAIAGLLRNDQSNSINKFPLLGDIPILGSLFRSSQFQNNQTELVILVTPYIVKPVDDPGKLATPLDGHKPATDAERILLGRLHGETEPLPTSEKSDAPAAAAAPGASGFAGIGGQAGFLIR